jgi:hypothetical protein
VKIFSVVAVVQPLQALDGPSGFLHVGRILSRHPLHGHAAGYRQGLPFYRDPLWIGNTKFIS